MKRSAFLKYLALLPAGAAAMKLTELDVLTSGMGAGPKMPALFIGHGSPENALLKNHFTESLGVLGKSMDRPRAILVVSAHWLTRGTAVSVTPDPDTIYDFGGFQKELYQITYDAPGAPDAAKETIAAISSTQVHEDLTMGLDHGAWTILRHLYPLADVPVFQLSIDYQKPAAYHLELGKQLASLREKGVLIIGSGNIVHNLGQLDFSRMDAPVMDWARDFDEQVRLAIDQRRYSDLANYQSLSQSARLAVPTNDHYLPLMYVLGAAGAQEEVSYTYEGFHYGSISMRGVMVGA